MVSLKQISNKEYEDWRQYQYDKINGRILQPDTIRFICESYDFDAEKIGQHFLELLPKLCPPETNYWMK